MQWKFVRQIQDGTKTEWGPSGDVSALFAEANFDSIAATFKLSRGCHTQEIVSYKDEYGTTFLLIQVSEEAA